MRHVLGWEKKVHRAIEHYVTVQSLLFLFVCSLVCLAALFYRENIFKKSLRLYTKRRLNNKRYTKYSAICRKLRKCYFYSMDIITYSYWNKDVFYIFSIVLFVGRKLISHRAYWRTECIYFHSHWSTRT